MKILSCDLETTGFNPSQDDWITGSFGILDFETLETIDEIELTSRPANWSEDAFEIHKIRKAVAMNFPERKETLDRLMQFIPKEPFYFLNHARPHHKGGAFYHFDFAFLKMDFFYNHDRIEFYKYLKDDLVISTDTMAVDLRKKGFHIPKSTSLSSLSETFSIKLDHHNARSDRKAMEEILRRLRELGKIGPSLI